MKVRIKKKPAPKKLIGHKPKKSWLIAAEWKNAAHPNTEEPTGA